LGDDSLDIASISALVAAIGVITGVLFAIVEIRHLSRTRQTEIILRSYYLYGSKEFQEAWAKVMTGKSDDFNDYNRSRSAAIQVGMLFESVGILVYRKVVNIDLAYDLFSDLVKIAWGKLKEFVDVARKQTDDPEIFRWFEYIYGEVQKKEQKLRAGQ